VARSNVLTSGGPDAANRSTGSWRIVAAVRVADIDSDGSKYAAFSPKFAPFLAYPVKFD
jgi:hypothetical protein